MSKVVEAIDAEIAKANLKREAVLSEINKRKEKVRVIESEITSLNRARRQLAADGAENGKPKRTLDARTVAGPKALRATASVLKRVKVMTQAAVTKETGLNSGTVSYALRTLEQDKVIRRTGRSVARSPEWEYVEQQGGSTVV